MHPTIQLTKLIMMHLHRTLTAHILTTIRCRNMGLMVLVMTRATSMTFTRTMLPRRLACLIQTELGLSREHHRPQISISLAAKEM